MACTPSMLTAEQMQAQAAAYQAGYWNDARNVHVAVVTGVSRTWAQDGAALNASRDESGLPLPTDATRVVVTLTPVLTLKGEASVEPMALSFNQQVIPMPACNAPLWRTHEDGGDIGGRYLVYSGFDTPRVGGDVQTVLSADLKDAATLDAWDAAAGR